MNKEIKISPYGSLLVYRKEYSVNDVKSIINENKLCGLRVFAHLKDDRLPNLEFLNHYTFLNDLNISTVDDFSFSFLNSLSGLKKLTISTIGDNAIDLSNQINLESLTIQWRKGKILGLEKCLKISSLCLIDYSEQDFTPVSSLLGLEDLMVKTSLINNCNGLENLTKLKSILFGNCKKLSSLDGMRNLKNISSLSYDLCPKINNFDVIGSLNTLEKLSINDCKGVKSIKFIEQLPSLKRLFLLGNTDIIDGDLQPAQKIQGVFYRHRKHYNITIKNEEQEALSKKNRHKIKEILSQYKTST